MNKPEPKFEVGDLVRRNSTGKVAIVTKVEWRLTSPGKGWYRYKITGLALWFFEENLTLVSSAKGDNQ